MKKGRKVITSLVLGLTAFILGNMSASALSLDDLDYNTLIIGDKIFELNKYALTESEYNEAVSNNTSGVIYYKNGLQNETDTEVEWYQINSVGLTLIDDISTIFTNKSIDPEYVNGVKIKTDPVITFDMPEEFVVGKAGEFSVTTTANDYAGTMIVGTGGLSDETAIASLQYLEINDNQWYDLPIGSTFGSSNGFQLADATSNFKVTFNKAGTYNVEFKLVRVSDNKVLASTTTTVNVRARIAPTAVINISDQTDVGLQEFTITVTANDYDDTVVNEILLLTKEQDSSYFESMSFAGNHLLADINRQTGVDFPSAETYNIKYSIVRVSDSVVLFETTKTVTVTDN